MKLAFVGRGGAGLCDWDSFALFRDNVQHYIEGGRKGGRFTALHAIAEAVDTGSCVVDAVRLRVELMHAWEALWQVDLENAAVSTRTEAVRRGDPIPVPESVTTPVANAAAHWPAASYLGQPVPNAARAFVSMVLGLTKAAVAGDVLQVRRLPSQLARRSVSKSQSGRMARR